ncbi:MAG: GNVR domain-containing protein, partial [Thermoanaerobaculia bacterium]
PAAVRTRQMLSVVEAEIKGLKVEEMNLRSAISSYQARVENAPRREQEFQELERDYDSTKQHYRTLLTRYEEAQLAENMEQAQKGEQFRLLDRGSPSDALVSPKRLQLVLIGLVVSLGLGGGVALLAEQLRPSFHTLDDLRAFTTLPVVARIPAIVTEADASRRRSRARIAAAAALVGVVLIVGTSYFVAKGNEQLVSMLSRSRS